MVSATVIEFLLKALGWPSKHDHPVETWAGRGEPSAPNHCSQGWKM